MLRAAPRPWMLLLWPLTACGDEPSPAPPTPALQLALPTPVDRDPRPEVLSVELAAQPTRVALGEGRTPLLWTYGGSVPGPLLRVPKGGTIEVDFVNTLTASTTVHWHGLRVPNLQDGVVFLGVAPIYPGQRQRYTLPAPDAGLYWYHPHVMSAQQLGAGLYGAILVDEAPGVEPDWADEEVVLVLSDLDLDAQGELADPQTGGELGTLFGREGEVLLVNGRVRPELTATVGQRQRWRLLNAARSRYYALSLPGHRWWIVGGDGGLADAPVEAERLLLVPGQRLDVIVEPTTPGTVPLSWVPYDRGYGSVEFRDPEVLLEYRVAEGGVATGEAPQAPPVVPPRIETTTSTRVVLHLTQSPPGEPLRLGINGRSGHDIPPIHAHVGDTFEFRVVNDMAFSHPFHLHGFFFEALDARGQPAVPRVLLDTVDVPREQERTFRVHFEGRPGMWMYHCHILDHADAGMMGMIMLGERH